MRTTYYGLVLFVALVFLAWWKRRHDAVARMNRGLSNYVVKKETTESD